MDSKYLFWSEAFFHTGKMMTVMKKIRAALGWNWIKRVSLAGAPN
jgi:hypothetical protein